MRKDGMVSLLDTVISVSISLALNHPKILVEWIQALVESIYHVLGIHFISFSQGINKFVFDETKEFINNVGGAIEVNDTVH